MSKVIATITNEGIEVELSNWDGVTNVMIERIYYAIVKQSHVYRAGKLGELRKEKMEAEAKQRGDAAKLVEGVVIDTKGPNGHNSLKGLKNVLTS